MKKPLETILEDAKNANPTLYGTDFNPSNYIRLSLDGETPEIRLDIKYRMMWFRAIYPEGSVRADILDKTETSVTVRVRLYKSYQDPLENSISEALCQRSLEMPLEEGEEYKKHYVDLAETYAKGRALANLGMDLLIPPQFDHQKIYEEWLGKPMANGETASVEESTPFEPLVPSVPTKNPTATNTPSKPTASTSTATTAPSKPTALNSTATTTPDKPSAPSSSVILIDGMSIPTEYSEAKKVLTVDVAKKIQGLAAYKDRTLGDMAIEEPKFLQWVATKCTDYKKAAAEILMEAAM